MIKATTFAVNKESVLAKDSNPESHGLSLFEQISSVITCEICSLTTSQLKMISCGHLLCQHCIEKISTGSADVSWSGVRPRSYKCPYCRTNIDVRSTPTDVDGVAEITKLLRDSKSIATVATQTESSAAKSVSVQTTGSTFTLAARKSCGTNTTEKSEPGPSPNIKPKTHFVTSAANYRIVGLEKDNSGSKVSTSDE